MQDQDKCLFCLDLPATVEAYPCLHLLCDTTCLRSYLEPVGLCMRCPICKASVTEYRDRKTKKTVFDVSPLLEVSDDSLAKWQKIWVEFHKNHPKDQSKAKKGGGRSVLWEQNMEILMGMCEYRPSDDEDDDDDDECETEESDLQSELLDLLS